MMKRALIGIALSGMLAGAMCAEPYDFYGNERYPVGGKPKPEVELYTVTEEGGGPQEYKRREVKWWPRKGVDIIEVQEGMPLRTWTWRAGPSDPALAKDLKAPEIERWTSYVSPSNNIADGFVRSVCGYIHPPDTGDYVFKICGDDRAYLFLSADDNPLNKRQIAGQDIYSMPWQWDRREGQVSLPVRLEGGRRYYIEATHIDLKGNDHLEVGWKGPGVTFAVIDGEYLSDNNGKRGGVTQLFMKLPSNIGQTQPFDTPKQFEAHLAGFRGIGNTMSSKYQGRDGGPIEPAVVLRLADGRKRMFARNSFCEADKKYIMEVYVKEMDRIMAGLDQTPFVSGCDPGNNAKPGEPGVMWVESAHFSYFSGSQGNCNWINEKEPEKAAWYREGTLKCAEFFRAMEEYAGVAVPGLGSSSPAKYTVTVAGTVRDGHELIPGYAGGGNNQCILKDAGGGPWSEGLFHEWGHGTRGGGSGMGGGEAGADAHGSVADPATLKGNHHITRPWRNLWNGINGYGYTDFYLLAGDDPNWGYAWAVCLPGVANEFSMLHTLARTGQQRGIYRQGVRGVGDLVGDYGARLTTFDCELEDVLQRERYAPARNWLEPVDRQKRIYRIPFEEAAEPFGVNMCRLVADPGANRMVVDFEGWHDPDRYSDWRACIIAVSADGARRYSPLWNKGKMELKLEPGDRTHWLSVAATPTALYTQGRGNPLGGNLGSLYSGRHAFLYPWQIQLQGAQPGTPRNRRADLDDADCIYKITDGVPAPHDTAAGKRFMARLKSLEKYLETSEAEAGDARLIQDSISFAKVGMQAELARMTAGARHPNGGGWVQATARAAPTAYVGPDAMVLGQAQVLDNAIIEDYAIVADSAVVADHARISGQGIVKRQAELRGYTRTWTIAENPGEAPVVPLRPGATELNRYGLWANYAMDRADKTVLEDWYRYACAADKGYGQNLVPVLNGYLHGEPAFVDDGGRRGFRFDGSRQWAELCPRVADLGEITIDLALKWEGKGEQTIFDLGSSNEFSLVLKTDRHGSPELVATVGDKRVVELAGKKALAPNQWVRLRIESDGQRTSLWMDGEKSAEVAGTFRPCDVFPAGAVKRNYLAVSRDMENYFKGVVDNAVFYHKAHADFSKLPPPVRDCPVRPTEEFVAAVKEQAGTVQSVETKFRALLQEQTKPYEVLRAQMKRREDDLLNRDKGYLAARSSLEAAKQELRAKELELSREFSQRKEITAKKNSHSGDERRFVMDGTRELKTLVNSLEGAFKRAADKAEAPYAPEIEWGRGLERSGFNGYYNTHYDAYLHQRAKEIMGGGEAREDVTFLDKLLKDLARKDNWHTSVDWEGPPEAGASEDPPEVRKWKERMGIR